MVVTALALIGIGANFWGFPVYVLDEAKNTACAMEMLQRGDWVTPTFNGQLRTDKPPLHYFLMMASYKVFGISAGSARLFSVIMGWLTVFVVYFFTRRMANERVALYAGLVMACSLFVMMEFHLAVPDPYFIFFLTWGWLSFGYAWQTDRRYYYDLSYVAITLAFMSKGPAALVLSAAVFVMFMALRGSLSPGVFRKVRFFRGLIAFLILAAPWWVAVWIRTDGAWVNGFIWEHNVGRFTAPYEDHSNVPGAAVLMLMVALLPLAGYLPGALYRGWLMRREQSLMFLAATAVVVVLTFFSVSRTLLPNYIGPAVPMAAILIGFGVDRHMREFTRSSSALRISALCIALVLSPLVPVLKTVIAGDRWIGDLPELAWAFLPWSLGAWAAAGFIYADRLKLALGAYGLSFWITGVVFFQWGVPRILEKNPVRLSQEQVRNSPDEVIGYRFFNAAYVFNLQRTFLTFWDLETLQNYRAGRPVMILTRDEDRAALEAAGFTVVFEHPYLFEGSTALIMTSRP